MSSKKKYKNSIYIKGARVHNLKNIDVEIPHNQLVIVTGLSGSGKSTLAFDTIFAEGQRRYVESLSAYARQFLGRIDKPEVDKITGIAPAIAIEQKVNTRNPRSTVGTSTEIYDYLKLLYARVGKTYSPISGDEVKVDYAVDIVEYIMSQEEGSRVLITTPLYLSEGQGIIEKLTLLLKDGFLRVYVEGEVQFIEDYLPSVTDKSKAEEIELIIDRTRTTTPDDKEMESRLTDSIERAFSYGDGICHVVMQDMPEGENLKEFSAKFEADGIKFEIPTEHLFSFNNPIGACPECEGYGMVTGIDEDLVIPDKTKSIYENAVAAWRGETMSRWKDRLVNNAHKFDFPVHRPYYELSKEQKQLIWTGNEYFKGLNSFFKFLESERYKIQYRVMLSRYTGKTLCPVCEGKRLRKEALYVKVGGLTIADMVMMPVDELAEFFTKLKLDERDTKMSHRIIIEVENRLRYLLDVGLGYLTLDRLSSTLSGGESQRINLSTSLGSNLVGSLYILDEPSIGLHPRDSHRLISVLKQLRDIGNTVIVVEHEEEIIRAADQIIDIGPGAGYKGGEIVYSGSFDGLVTAKNSLTAEYLTGKRSIEYPEKYRSWKDKIVVKGARENNLQGADIEIPLGVISCITGVSGSGKSSLVKGILYPAIKRELDESGDKPGDFDRLEGDIKKLVGVELVDQNPIGRSSRSNPSTYIKAYDDIRRLYADLPYSQHSGFTPSHFSFNTVGGRCEECQGDGSITVSMQFMADVELKCDVCNGKRFKDEVLEAKYKGRSIFDVLEMTVDDAIDFFGNEKDAVNKRIVRKLSALQDVGLGYVRLGQSSSTLSGGESQRVKLASFLLRDNDEGGILFIFDEPTTGLHLHDTKKLLDSFNALIEKGHTIVIVEHNMDVIKSADWIIDLGPEAGDRGGNVVFAGTPDEIERCEESYTGRYLLMHTKRHDKLRKENRK